MKKELQDQLFEKYPAIFRDRNQDMTQTCMCWGIETGDGWYGLLDKLCGWLQWQTDKNRAMQVVADQVKEKFGTLCFYHHMEETENSKDSKFDSCEYMRGAVDFAESLSGTICELCGQPGKVIGTGWLTCRCEECAKKEQGKD